MSNEYDYLRAAVVGGSGSAGSGDNGLRGDCGIVLSAQANLMRRSWLVGVMVVLLMVAGLSAFRVQASPLYQETDTPTVTPTATVTGVPFLFATERTPAYTPDNLQCPGGPPYGWGTVTPGVGWWVLCSQCLVNGVWQGVTPSSTPGPTWTQGAGPTWTAGPSPTATKTPTPTITLTATKTLTPTPGIVGSVAVLPPLSVYYDGGRTSGFRYSAPVDAGVGNYYIVNSTYGTYMSVVYACRSNHPNDGATFSVCTSANGTTCLGSPRLLSSECTGGYGKNIYKSETVGAVGLDGNTTSRYLLIRSSMGGTSGYLTIYSVVVGNVWMGWPVMTPTATPGTPTATPGAGYCATVGEDTEAGFSYTGITFGASQCFDIGPVGGFSILGLDFPGIPWIAHLCIQGVSLGVLTVFGLGLALDAIAIVGGVVLIIREFT